MSGLAPGRGYFEALAGVRGEGPAWAAYARGELGAKFAPGWSTFAALEAKAALGVPVAWSATAGVRGSW